MPCLALSIAPLTNLRTFGSQFRLVVKSLVVRAGDGFRVQPLAFGAEPPFTGGYGPSRDYCIAIIFRVVTAKTGI